MSHFGSRPTTIMARSRAMSGPSSIAMNREDMEGPSSPERSVAKTTKMSCKFQAVILNRLEAKWRPLIIESAGEPEFSANFDRQASATNSVLFLGLSPPKANKTVSFFVSFHRGATQSGILFLVSIERGTSRRVYHCRPWLSDVSHAWRCSLSVPCAAWLWRASVLSDRSIDRHVDHRAPHGLSPGLAVE